ncbi:MAG: homoserine dehydrogenase [Alphaproteobacteria bacterium]
MSGAVHIGIAGLGTVGAGTVRILQQHAGLLAERCGRKLLIAGVSAHSKNKQRDCDISGIAWFDDPVDMAQAAGIDLVVEVIGGAQGVAHHMVEAALKSGKPVVTANKALVATHGLALAKLSERHNATLAFEAAVCGGIPVIKALRDGLASNRVSSIRGILNATTNVLLTNMAEKKQDLGAVMDEAAKLGLLEADPSLDVDGHDAAQKLAILSALAFGCAPDVASVYREGIRAVTLRDIDYAGRLGYGVKLLAIATYGPNGLMQRVHPCLLPLESYLARVKGALNTVMLRGDAAGDVVLQGLGGGEGPTASAVVSDIIDIARGGQYKPFTLPTDALKPVAAQSFESSVRSYYLRLAVEDRAGVLATVTELLRQHNISVRTFLQEDHPDGELAELVLTTHDTGEAAMRKALAALEKQDTVKEPAHMIRIEQP